MLIITSQIGEYFQTTLDSVLKESGAELSSEIQAYVVYLLSDFARSENLYAGVDSGEKPALALMLKRALECPEKEANRIFRHIGDTTLYSLGFFEEQSLAPGVSADYYRSMGEDAYAKLAINTRQSIYQELADDFENLVILIKQISLSDRKVEPKELLTLIDQYQQSGNPQLKAFLLKNGVSISNAKPHLPV